MIESSPSPLVSIILPVYNGEAFLEEAIISVLQQTFRNYELIIINDGSSDSSEDIILKFNDDRIRYIKNVTNLKLIKTLNKGIENCNGKYIARMDADDICHPERLQKQVAFLEANPEYILCGSWARKIDFSNKVTGAIKRIDSNGLLKVNILFTTPFIHPTVMLRADIMLKENYSEDALHCEDLEYWLRLSEKHEGKFYNIPEYLLDYRIHESNVSVQNNDFQRAKRKEVIGSFVKRFVGHVSNHEIEYHFMLFTLPKKTSSQTFVGIKAWILKLKATNSRKKSYNSNDLDALLFSRWILLCVKSKKINQIFGSGIKWWNPKVLRRVVRLLRYKS